MVIKQFTELGRINKNSENFNIVHTQKMRRKEPKYTEVYPEKVQPLLI